jgi:hypothetical protein
MKKRAASLKQNLCQLYDSAAAPATCDQYDTLSSSFSAWLYLFFSGFKNFLDISLYSI